MAASDAIVASVIGHADPGAMATSPARKTTIAIRSLDGQVRERLRIRAARNGRSIDAEACVNLATILGSEGNDQPNLAKAIRRRVAPFGGIELDQHSSVAIGEPPVLGP